MAAAPSSELLFQHPRATSAALVFGGDDDTTGPVAAVTVNAAFALGGVHVRATVSAPVRVLVAATLGGVNISAAVVYDNRVTRWLDQRAAAPHQTARSMPPQWSGGWGTPARERRGDRDLAGGDLGVRPAGEATQGGRAVRGKSRRRIGGRRHHLRRGSRNGRRSSGVALRRLGAGGQCEGQCQDQVTLHFILQ